MAEVKIPIGRVEFPCRQASLRVDLYNACERLIGVFEPLHKVQFPLAFG